MIENRTLTEEQSLIKRHFIDFFESERNEKKYQNLITNMMNDGKYRLIIDLADLLDYTPSSISHAHGFSTENQGTAMDSSLGRCVITEPGRYVPLLELALHDIVSRLQQEYLKVDYRYKRIRVGFSGPTGIVLSPRELYAHHLNTMVALEGIVTRQSPNRPRVIETVHYCVETNKFTRREFRDQLTPMIDSSHLPTVNVMPKTDMEGNILRTEYGLSTFTDSQCAVLQEAPERAPTGQLPRSVELRFDDDLVDSVKPGDRVVLVGVYMPYTSADRKSFHSIVLVNHIIPAKGFSLIGRLLESEKEMLISFARKCTEEHGPGGILKVLSKSIAPSIYGLTDEKKAILLMLVGGVERSPRGSHIRGDINILIVGEPSTAKSHLLRFVLGVAPLALSTTGKGSSGVGLTAAVTTDSYTGERSLSAGAMVLADRGVLCIDEFDKMNTLDRVAMHEAMEQQTVTIAKAGIHASLNARCSVLAAANPIYGFYSVHHRLAFNVGLPESLLSRFDLIFIVLDQHSSDFNRRISKHILRNHMTYTPVGMDPVVTKTVVDGIDSMRENHSEGNRGNADSSSGSYTSGMDFKKTTDSTGQVIESIDFLRAYIQLAKSGTPNLAPESQILISEQYVQLREEQNESSRDGFAITPRTLEAIVRLSTAHAKLRLSPSVDPDDVLAAMALLRASVHATATASSQRELDNLNTLKEYRNDRKRKRDGNPNSSEINARGDKENENEISAANPSRTDKSQPSMPGNAEKSTVESANAVFTRRVIEALKQFQKRSEGSSLSLRELRTMLGPETSVSQLQQTLEQLQGDIFIFEAEEGPSIEDSFIQFI